MKLETLDELVDFLVAETDADRMCWNGANLTGDLCGLFFRIWEQPALEVVDGERRYNVPLSLTGQRDLHSAISKQRTRRVLELVNVLRATSEE